MEKQEKSWTFASWQRSFNQLFMSPSRAVTRQAQHNIGILLKTTTAKLDTPTLSQHGYNLGLILHSERKAQLFQKKTKSQQLSRWTKWQIDTDERWRKNLTQDLCTLQLVWWRSHCSLILNKQHTVLSRKCKQKGSWRAEHLFFRVEHSLVLTLKLGVTLQSWLTCVFLPYLM